MTHPWVWNPCFRTWQLIDKEKKKKKKKNAKSILHKHIKISNHYLLLGLSLRATAVASLRSFLSLASSAAIRTACSYIVVRRQQRIWCKRRNRYQLLLHMNNLYSSSWENDVKLVKLFTWIQNEKTVSLQSLTALSHRLIHYQNSRIFVYEGKSYFCWKITASHSDLWTVSWSSFKGICRFLIISSLIISFCA